MFKTHPWVTLLAATGIVWSAIYSIWLFNRVIFGSIVLPENPKKDFYLKDLNRNEILIFIFLTAGMLLLGINSSIVTNLTNIPIQIIENIIAKKL